MGTRDRTRPDESRKPGHITAEGYRRLQEEADQLWHEERPRLTKAVAIAAAEGDRSENAEYIYGKRRMAEIDRRLRMLGNRLDVLTIVEGPARDDGKVYFGSWVVLETQEGDRVCYRLMGPDETDVDRGFISVDSPMGKALMGKEAGDEVLVRRPRGDAVFEIVEVCLKRPG